MWQQCLPKDRLKWTKGYDSYPIWPSEPKLSTINEIVSSCIDETDVKVQFLADGANHKVYDVVVPSRSAPYIFRVVAPIDPNLKMENEMATLAFLRKNTSMPVTRPMFWYSSEENELGYEWCLVKKLPGVELRQVWREVPWRQKLTLIDSMADFISQLWSRDLKFNHIGSLYFKRKGPQHPEIPGPTFRPSACTEIFDAGTFEIGESVDSAFFSGRRLYLDSFRGPFKSCHDWIEALIKVQQRFVSTGKILLDSKDMITEEFEEDDVEDEIGIDDDSSDDSRWDFIFEKYLRMTPEIFSSTDKTNNEARFSLFHCDLREANILVDPKTFDTTGIIDWEQGSTVPDWYGHDYPMFINKHEPFNEAETAVPSTYDSDDEDYNGAAVSSRDRWEAKQLRNRFDSQMEKRGFKDWRPHSTQDKAKSTFIQGIPDLIDFKEKAESALSLAKKQLGRHTSSFKTENEREKTRRNEKIEATSSYMVMWSRYRGLKGSEISCHWFQIKVRCGVKAKFCSTATKSPGYH